MSTRLGKPRSNSRTFQNANRTILNRNHVVNTFVDIIVWCNVRQSLADCICLKTSVQHLPKGRVSVSVIL